MKRNLFALLLALVMVTGCIFSLTPAVLAETTESTEESTEAPTEIPTEAPTEEPTEVLDDTDAKAAKSPIQEPLKSIIVFIIKFFKNLLAYLGL